LARYFSFLEVEKMHKKILTEICCLIFNITICYSVEIPLGKITTSEKSGSVGYVDIEKVFSLHPKILTAKLEYNRICAELNEQLYNKKQEIVEMEQKIDELKESIDELKKQLEVNVSTGSSDVSVSSTTAQQIEVSTMTAKSDQEKTQKDLDELQKLFVEKSTGIELKKKEYEDMEKETETKLFDFEQSNTLGFMGEMYKVLEKIAIENKISVIIDKPSILYGEPGIDFTEEVKNRLRGK